MERTKDTYQKTLYEFIRYDIDVICPKCGSHALVKTAGFIAIVKNDFLKVKFTCLHCGNSKLFSEKSDMSFSIHMGISADPFFELPLWYVDTFEEHTLWVYNLEHLDYIVTHIQAKLRERVGQNINRSVGSRLPRWMTSKKNRDKITKALEDLRQKK